ncbi:MAG: alpha/beta hydrolase [Erythrobacter sp.]
MKRLIKILAVIAALLVIAFIALRTPDTDPAEMRAKYGGEPSQFVSLANGQTVHLRDEGPRDAPAIVFLHGSNADLHTWQPWVDGLKDNYRVIRFDQVGHGLTGADRDGDYSLDGYVADIDALAQTLGLDSFILGGSSMGGGHTLAYAMAHPEKLAGLVLVDASGAPRVVPEDQDEGGNIGFTIARTPIVNKVMEHITPRSLVAQSFAQSVSNQEIVTEEAIDRYWELLRYPGNRTATIARFGRDYEPFSPSQLAALDMPALIVWGTEDALIPLESGRWLDQQLPHSTLAEYSGIGHLPQEEAPVETLADLREWLLTLDLAGQGA